MIFNNFFKNQVSLDKSKSISNNVKNKITLKRLTKLRKSRFMRNSVFNSLKPYIKSKALDYLSKYR